MPPACVYGATQLRGEPAGANATLVICHTGGPGPPAQTAPWASAQQQQARHMPENGAGRARRHVHRKLIRLLGLGACLAHQHACKQARLALGCGGLGAAARRCGWNVCSAWGRPPTEVAQHSPEFCKIKQVLALWQVQEQRGTKVAAGRQRAAPALTALAPQHAGVVRRRRLCFCCWRKLWVRGRTGLQITPH